MSPKAATLQFRYTALAEGGKRREGSIAAADRADAVKKLKREGLVPLELAEVASGTAPARKAEKTSAATPTAASSSTKRRSAGGGGSAAAEAPVPSGGLRLKFTQVIDFTEEMSDLLAAGIPIDDALSLVERRKEKSSLQALAAGVGLYVKEGKTLSEALRRTSASFGELYCSLVSAGEASGSLGIILKRHADYLRSMRELKSKVVGAMVYPSFLLFSGLLVMALFVSYLLPRLAKMLEAQHSKLPLPAALLMQAGDFLKSHWLFVLIGLLVAALVIRMAFRQPAVKAAWDALVLRIPGVGNLLMTRFHVQFTETLAGLLSNGLTMQKAINLSRNTTQNIHLRDRVNVIGDLVSNGSSLANALEKSTVFPAAVCDIVRIGEHTGTLSESLAKAGERLDRDLGRRMETIGHFFQPFIILLLAGVVGGMAWIMMGSVFETISKLQNR